MESHENSSASVAEVIVPTSILPLEFGITGPGMMRFCSKDVNAPEIEN